MPILNIDLTTAEATRLIEAYGQGYQEQVDTINEDGSMTLVDNPETKAQYAKRMLLQSMRSKVVSYEQQQAMEQLTSVDFNGTIN